MKKDLSGEIFGRLFVVKEAGRTPAKKVCWECVCTCGKSIIVIGASLVSGRTKSCGCFNQEKRNERNAGNSFSEKHGMTGSKLHNVWRQMKQRCHSKTHKMYSKYGGRGIFVCEEWREDFNNFYKWAIKSGYGEKLTIERKDNNRGYSPDNCLWVSQREQNLNMSRS